MVVFGPFLLQSLGCDYETTDDHTRKVSGDTGKGNSFDDYNTTWEQIITKPQVPQDNKTVCLTAPPARQTKIVNLRC